MPLQLERGRIHPAPMQVGERIPDPFGILYISDPVPTIMRWDYLQRDIALIDHFIDQNRYIILRGGVVLILSDKLIKALFQFFKIRRIKAPEIHGHDTILTEFTTGVPPDHASIFFPLDFQYLFYGHQIALVIRLTNTPIDRT